MNDDAVNGDAVNDDAVNGDAVNDDAVNDDAVNDEPSPTEGTEEATPEQRRALFRVVRGAPDDAELAALTVVVAAAASASGGEEEAPAAPDLWSHPAALLRAPLRPGPGAWRASGLPR